MTATLHVIQPHSCGVTVRPCPADESLCRHHTGYMPRSCTLDVVRDNEDGASYSDIARVMDLDPERIRQIAREAAEKFAREWRRLELRAETNRTAARLALVTGGRGAV